MKKIKKTLLYLLGLIALLLMVTVVINLPVFDEELLPEVVAIKNIQAEPYSENNAYPALIAINGTSGKSLKEESEAVRSILNHKIADTGLDYLNAAEFETLIGKDHDESWLNSYSSCKSRSDKNCTQKLNDELRAKPVSDPRLIEQLERYTDLIEFNHYKEMTQIDVDTPMGPYGPLMKIKQIFLADKLVNYSEDIYSELAIKDMKFWRMILRKSHLLITNMVSVASLNDSVQSISTAINHGLSDIQLERLQPNLKPLNLAETDLSQVFNYEFKYGLSVADYTSNNMFGGFIENLLFQPQATNNTRYFLTTKHMKKVARYDSRKFYQYVSSNKLQKDFNQPFKWSLNTLYNPSGKKIISYIMPAYKDYFGRVHDLNGMIHLLKLQIEIALNPNKPVEQVIAQSKFTNPYTLKPMGYKPESHSIYFECMDKTSVCELDL